MEFIIDILNATAKAQGRDLVMEAVEVWLGIKKGEKFLEANPGLSFGDAPAVRQRALSAEAAEYVPVADGMALLAEAAEQAFTEDNTEEGLEQLATAMAAAVLEAGEEN